jgi:hypothetical protein
MEKQSSIDREAPRKLFPTSNSQPRVDASVSRNEKSGDGMFKVQPHSLTVLRSPVSRWCFEPAASHHELTPLTP